MDKRRYVLDALYGRIQFSDSIWEAIITPEIQRLRDVRLCNINSLSLTGGANTNRFEHALGTCYLAGVCIDSWPRRVSSEERRRFLLAALIHDIGSAAFGHSVQYVIGSQGFEHESVVDILLSTATPSNGGYQYRHTLLDPIYCGMPPRLPDILSTEELHAVGRLVAGEGEFGPLINGSLDLDNMDNVFRLAYHYGLVRSGDSMQQLAANITIGDSALVVSHNAVHLVQEWCDVRKRLYDHLLLNPDEFSAKCMLEEALQLAQQKPGIQFRWSDVDYQLLMKLRGTSSAVAEIVNRLTIGDLYGCIGIFACARLEAYGLISQFSSRRELEERLTTQLRADGSTHLRRVSVALHAIRDVDKTSRQIVVNTTAGQRLEIGSSSRRVLIGVFARNVNLSALRLRTTDSTYSSHVAILAQGLRDALGDQSISGLELFSEWDHE